MVADVSDRRNGNGEPNPLPNLGGLPIGPLTYRGRWLVVETRISYRIVARRRSPSYYKSSPPSAASTGTDGSNNDSSGKDGSSSEGGTGSKRGGG